MSSIFLQKFMPATLIRKSILVKVLKKISILSLLVISTPLLLETPYTIAPYFVKASKTPLPIPLDEPTTITFLF